MSATPGCNCPSHGLVEEYRHGLACPYGVALRRSPAAREASKVERYADEIVELTKENARLRAQHADFVESLTRSLNEAGVPAMPSWQAAIDFLVGQREHYRDELRRMREQYEAESLTPRSGFDEWKREATAVADPEQKEVEKDRQLGEAVLVRKDTVLALRKHLAWQILNMPADHPKRHEAHVLINWLPPKEELS